MQIYTRKTPDLQALADSIGQMDSDPKVASMVIFASSQNGYDPDRVGRILQKVRKPLIGGLFPRIIAGAEAWDQGFIILGLPHPMRQLVVGGLSRPSHELTHALDEVLPGLDAHGGTLFVLVDGMARSIGTLIEQTYNYLGMGVSYLGGGCGSIDFRPIPCVLTNQGILGDAGVLAWFPDLHAHIGVAHGWTSISLPIKVTASSGGRIESLDWKPAFEVYREIVEQHAGIPVTEENFLEVARSHPFGISKLDSEMVVRDPFAKEGQTILCFGEVPRGSLVHILHGTEDGLLQAAAQALRQASRGCPTEAVGPRIVMDCVSRALFLGKDFQKELGLLADPSLSTVGALSIGEIANFGDDYLELFNKTAVAGILEL